MKPTPTGWPRISSAVYYEDAPEAIDWLCRAFGFEVRVRIEGEGGSIEHSELTYGSQAFVSQIAALGRRREHAKHDGLR
jgi:uncharacterized glyoxalase superfamily protein PhnB